MIKSKPTDSWEKGESGIKLLFEGEENNLKYYLTEDAQYSVIERVDGECLLYKLNPKSNDYEWTESYYESIEACKAVIKAKKYM